MGSFVKHMDIHEATVTIALPLIEYPFAEESDERRASFEREALVHLDALFRVAVRFAGTAADADDLVQDTFFRAYQAWDQFERGTNAKGWLITILRHVFINDYRRNVRRRQILTSDAPPAVEHATVRFFDELVDDEVVRAIDALPLQFREVVMLRDVEDLTYEEVATMLDIPVGTVKSRLFRARELLQKALRAYAVSTGVIRDRFALSVGLLDAIRRPG
jgi:RNA polymerase sigma-70 factor (ECF subfamily)